MYNTMTTLEMLILKYPTDCRVLQTRKIINKLLAMKRLTEQEKRLIEEVSEYIKNN